MEDLIKGAFLIFLALYGAYLIVTYWVIALCIAIAAAGIFVAYLIWANKREKARALAEQIRQQEEQKRRQEELQRLAEEHRQDVLKTGFFRLEYRGRESQGVMDSFRILNEVTKHPFLIDTNLWMEYSELKCFWAQLAHCCRKNQCKVTIPSEVYDEIINLAKSSKNSDTRYKARTAKKLLYELDNENLLSVYQLGVTRNKASYADPVLLRVCREIISAGHSCYLFTNDRDLIIRARQLLNKQQEVCKVLSVHTTDYSDEEEEFFIPGT